ncbi:MAG: hypothetical protein U0992_24915 [Planctomycetaceae bacterium]
MFSLAFRRIVWKEWRAQASLWVALLIGAILLQAIVVFINHATPALHIATVILVLTACFVAASLSLSFAGETEDGTRDWLRQLPVRPSVLISAKLAFALLATLLFLAACSATGYVVIALSGRSVADLSNSNLPQLAQSIVGLLAWGLFFSPRCRKVLTAIVAAVVAQIVVIQLTDNLVRNVFAGWQHGAQFGDEMQSLSFFVITGVVLLFALVTAPRWGLAGVASATTVAAPPRRRALQTPLAELLHQAWLPMVEWAARRGSPAARETAVLVWREARAAVPFGAIWGFVGLLLIDILSCIGGEVRQTLPAQPLFLIATPVLCGLLTCFSDQRHQTYLFLGERGASPFRVWCIKQAVWLLLAVLFVVLFLRWDSTAASALRANPRAPVSLLMTGLTRLHVPTMLPQVAYDRPEDVALQRHFLWALSISLFAAGQCAAFWIRRGILALAATLIAAPVLVIWHVVLTLGDVPFAIASWPLSIALMAATLVSAGVWLRGRDSWKLRSVRLAAIVLPVCATVTTAAAHRANSLPPFDFLQLRDAYEIISRMAANRTHDAAWSNRWRAVLSSFRSSPISTRGHTIPSEQHSRVRQELIELSEKIGAANRPLDPVAFSPDENISVELIAAFLTERAIHSDVAASDASSTDVALHAQGEVVADASVSSFVEQSVDEQWRALAAGLRITRYLSHESVTPWQFNDCLRARRQLLAAIRAWTLRAEQTPAALTAAFEVLTGELVAPISARQMVINRFAFYSQLLEHRGRKWEQIQTEFAERSFLPTDDGVRLAAAMPVFERVRARRLLGQVTEEELQHDFVANEARRLRGQELGRWAATTSGLPLDAWETSPTEFGDYAPDGRRGLLKQSRVYEAATVLMLALQRYRLEHDEFPASLVGLIPPDLAPRLMDENSQAPFGYEPHGLPDDLYLPGGQCVRAGQPLLWTSGITGSRIARAMEAIPFGRDETLTVPRGAYFLTGVQYSPVVTNLAEVPPVQVLFVEPTFQIW